MNKVNILIYKYAGKKGPFRITKECEECDITIPLIKKISNDIGTGECKVEVEVKPWLDNFFTALLRGGWHAPIVIINGKIFSQGIVPDMNKFMEAVKREMR